MDARFAQDSLWLYGKIGTWSFRGILASYLPVTIPAMKLPCMSSTNCNCKTTTTALCNWLQSLQRFIFVYRFEIWMDHLLLSVEPGVTKYGATCAGCPWIDSCQWPAVKKRDGTFAIMADNLLASYWEGPISGLAHWESLALHYLSGVHCAAVENPST